MTRFTDQEHIAAQTNQIWLTTTALRINRRTTRDPQECEDLRHTLRVCIRFAETPALEKRAAEALQEDDRLRNGTSTPPVMGQADDDFGFDHVALQTTHIWRLINALRINRETSRDPQERDELRETLRSLMRFAETPALEKRAADALREDDRLHREAERQCASSA